MLGHALAMVPASTSVLLVSTRTIDWDGFRATAAERDARLEQGTIESVSVVDPQFDRFYKA